MIRRLRSTLSLKRDAKVRTLLLLKKKCKEKIVTGMRLLFLERDIDKALRRMALEEEKNLTETVNDILWKGLKDYLKQTGTNHVLHRKGTVSGFTPLLDKDGKPVVSQSPSFPQIRNAQVLQTRTYAFLLHDLLMNEKGVRRFCNRIYAETPHIVRSL